MHSEIERQVDGVWRCAPWEQVVVDAAPHDHIVQLYQDQDFLNRAVCRFAGAAVANGEGIILVPTHTPGTPSAHASRRRAETWKRRGNEDS